LIIIDDLMIKTNVTKIKIKDSDRYTILQARNLMTLQSLFNTKIVIYIKLDSGIINENVDILKFIAAYLLLYFRFSPTIIIDKTKSCILDTNI